MQLRKKILKINSDRKWELIEKAPDQKTLVLLVSDCAWTRARVRLQMEKWFSKFKVYRKDERERRLKWISEYQWENLNDSKSFLSFRKNDNKRKEKKEKKMFKTLLPTIRLMSDTVTWRNLNNFSWNARLRLLKLQRTFPKGLKIQIPSSKSAIELKCYPIPQRKWNFKIESEKIVLRCLKMKQEGKRSIRGHEEIFSNATDGKTCWNQGHEVFRS